MVLLAYICLPSGTRCHVHLAPSMSPVPKSARGNAFLQASSLLISVTLSPICLNPASQNWHFLLSGLQRWIWSVSDVAAEECRMHDFNYNDKQALKVMQGTECQSGSHLQGNIWMSITMWAFYLAIYFLCFCWLASLTSTTASGSAALGPLRSKWWAAFKLRGRWQSLKASRNT